MPVRRSVTVVTYFVCAAGATAGGGGGGGGGADKELRRSIRSCPANGVVPTPSTVTPTFPNVLSIVGMMAKIPMEPVSVAGLAQISSAGAEM